MAGGAEVTGPDAFAYVVREMARLPSLATLLVAHDLWSAIMADDRSPPDNRGRPYMRFHDGRRGIAVVECGHIAPGTSIPLDAKVNVIEPDGALTPPDEHGLWPAIQLALKLPPGKRYHAATCACCGAPGQALVCEYCGVRR
jgi:hypothetical protein